MPKFKRLLCIWLFSPIGAMDSGKIKRNLFG